MAFLEVAVPAPGCESAFVDGLAPCRENRRETGCMIIGDAVGLSCCRVDNIAGVVRFGHGDCVCEMVLGLMVHVVEVKVPKLVNGGASACYNCDAVIYYGGGCIGESGGAAVVTELSDGN